VWAWIQARPLAADAALAAVLLGAALVSSDVTLGLFRDDPALAAPDATAVGAGLAAMILPLALRRRFPVVVLLTCTAAYFVLSQLTGPELEPAFTAISISLAFYRADAILVRIASRREL